MTDLETLVIEMAAGLKVLTSTAALTAALLPPAERQVVLDALTALSAESLPGDLAEQSQVVNQASAEAAKALAAQIAGFAAELASRGSPPGEAAVQAAPQSLADLSG